MAVTAGRVFLDVNDTDALCLDLHSGKQLWRTPAPSPPISAKLFEGRYEGRGEMTAIATPKAYVIFDVFHAQNVAFAAEDGRLLWSRTNPERYPLLFADALLNRGSVQCDVLSGQPVTTYAHANAFQEQGDSCGHATALQAGLWVGGGVWDMKTGKQLLPHLTKSGCGLGFFVADGAEVLYPNMCGWRHRPPGQSPQPVPVRRGADGLV